MHPAVAVAFALLFWIAIAIGLVRRAERRATTGALPAPYGAAAIAAVLAVLSIVVRPASEAAMCGVACTGLVVAAGADLRRGYLFDAITLPSAVVVATLAFATGTVANAASGVALCVGGFGAIVLCSRGRMMGLGDVKALYAVGAAFGPLEALVVIFAACLSGIVTALVAHRFRQGEQIRFGPHLAAGAAFALLLGNSIRHNWMGL